MNLSEVKVGNKVLIKEINYQGKERNRLIELGFCIGESIEVKKFAPLGDPMQIFIKDFSVAMRKTDAKNIIVE